MRAPRRKRRQPRKILRRPISSSHATRSALSAPLEPSQTSPIYAGGLYEPEDRERPMGFASIFAIRHMDEKTGRFRSITLRERYMRAYNFTRYWLNEAEKIGPWLADRFGPEKRYENFEGERIPNYSGPSQAEMDADRARALGEGKTPGTSLMLKPEGAVLGPEPPVRYSPLPSNAIESEHIGPERQVTHRDDRRALPGPSVKRLTADGQNPPSAATNGTGEGRSGAGSTPQASTLTAEERAEQVRRLAREKLAREEEAQSKLPAADRKRLAPPDQER